MKWIFFQVCFCIVMPDYYKASTIFITAKLNISVKNFVIPSVLLTAMQRRRVLSRTNGGLQKQLKEPAVFTHTPSSQAFPNPHSS